MFTAALFITTKNWNDLNIYQCVDVMECLYIRILGSLLMRKEYVCANMEISQSFIKWKLQGTKQCHII